MIWTDYMINAANHSKGSASHWFRYLRKDINNKGIYFTDSDIEYLFNCEELTMFQRISLKAAFTEGTPTNKHISGLNGKKGLGIFQKVLEAQYEDRF